MNENIKNSIKAILPMNFIRSLKSGVRAENIKKMGEIPRIPFERSAFPAGINMIGCFTQDSGLGESCRIVAKDIEAAGIPHSFVDISNYEWVGPDRTFQDKITNEFKYGINLWHVNMHLFEKAWSLTKDQWDRHYNIAFWSWENETFPKEWIPLLHMVDEVWTPSEFISEAIRKVTKKPVITLPHVIEVHPEEGIGRKYFHLPDDKFLYLMLYDANSISDRKNPDAAIEAFRKAFKPADSVALVIKISHGSDVLLSQLKRKLDGYDVYFIRDMLPKSYVDALIQCCNVYVSLHRAEGFGLVLGEAMALGVPTVATAYSGNLEFQNETNASLVPVKLVSVGKEVWPYRKDYVWADPNTDDAAAQMRALFENVDLYDRIRNNGIETVHTILSRQYAIDIVKAQYTRIYSE